MARRKRNVIKADPVRVEDLMIERWSDLGNPIFQHEIKVTHVPTGRESYQRGNNETQILIEALSEIRKMARARMRGKVFLFFNDFLERLEKHFWCAFFHRRDRCYPGVDRPYPWNSWHCTRCYGCGAAIDWLMEKPLRGPLGLYWYLRPVEPPTRPSRSPAPPAPSP